MNASTKKQAIITELTKHPEGQSRPELEQATLQPLGSALNTLFQQGLIEPASAQYPVTSRRTIWKLTSVVRRRKVTQIAACKGTLFVLCDDGSIWAAGFPHGWDQVEPIP